jgi:hypothetical protein
MSGETIYYDQTETYSILVDEHEVFEAYYDALVFLAVVGYQEDEYVELESADGEIKLSTVLGTESYRTIITSLAFQHVGEPEALVDRGQQTKIIAGYAAGGEWFLQREFKSLPTGPVDEIVSYVRSTRKEDGSKDGILGQIVRSFDDDVLSVSD